MCFIISIFCTFCRPHLNKPLANSTALSAPRTGQVCAPAAVFALAGRDAFDIHSDP